MRKHVSFLFFIIPAVFIFSCAPKPSIVLPPEWGYEKGAVRLHMKADPQLNLYSGSPHTLLLCIYSLRDPNAFNQLADEKDGLSKLLECGRFDPSVTNSKRLVVNPGQEMSESLDRAEGAKYVGIVAGYYQLFQKERAVRFYPIPVLQEKKGNTIVSKPDILKLDLLLGPQEMQEVKGK
jgi:type VI secretion system VasD/TssJ family lipoprotein